MAEPSEWDRLVNSQWPTDVSLVPTEQEAIAGVKRLWRKGMGRPWRGKIRITSGNRYTWVRCGVLYINLERRQVHRVEQGWPDIIHLLAHYIHHRKFPAERSHHYTELEVERELTSYAIENGFHTGSLKREKKGKPDRDVVVERHARAVAREEMWGSKLRRAENALAKAQTERSYYERKYPERVL